MSFSPKNYSNTNSNITITDGVNEQRAEAVIDLSGWVLTEYNNFKSTGIATNGTDSQRVSVVYNLGGSNSSSGNSSGTNNYNDLLNKPAIDGIELNSKTTKESLGIDLTNYCKLSDIISHNLSVESHNDIRNYIKDVNDSVKNKAEQTVVKDIDNRLILSEEDIDALQHDMAVFIGVSKNAALKNDDNIYTGGNTYQGNVAFDGNQIHLTNGASIKDGNNDKTILTTIKIDNNTQQTYLGNDKVWIKGVDEVLIEGSTIKTKRPNTNNEWREYINIDSGNILDFITSANDKYGIEADYNTHYGILDCPNGLIEYNANDKEVEIQPGVVLQLAGADTKTIISSKTKYEIEETGKLVLFFSKTISENGTIQLGFIEAGEVYYQEDEPTNGVTSFLAWWKPSLKTWQFKSVYTGNVWRTAIATPIANVNAGENNIISINYIGYRIIDDDIFVQMSDIESLQDVISTINTNVSTLDTQVNALAQLTVNINNNTYTKTEVNDLVNNSHNSSIVVDATLEGNGTSENPLKLSQIIHKDLDDAIASVTELNADAVRADAKIMNLLDVFKNTRSGFYKILEDKMPTSTDTYDILLTMGNQNTSNDDVNNVVATIIAINTSNNKTYTYTGTYENLNSISWKELITIPMVEDSDASYVLTYNGTTKSMEWSPIN